MKARAGLVAVACVLAAILALVLIRSLRSAEEAGAMAPVEETRRPALPIAPTSSAAPMRSEGLAPRDPVVAYRAIRTVDPAGEAIAGAAVFLCEQIEHASNVKHRRTLGRTEADGRILVLERTLLDAPNDTITARARGFLPGLIAVASAGSDEIRLTLAPELRQSVHFTDLHGDPVPGVVVMLSRTAIPRDYCENGVDPDLEQGFDPVNALHSGVSDAAGNVEFGELIPGRYVMYFQSECNESADQHQTMSIEVPGPVVEIKLTTLLCAVVKVTGDELYTWSITIDGPDWISTAGMSRSLDALRKRLRDRYPGCLVFAGCWRSLTAPMKTIPADLLLARTGKKRVELLLEPACTDPKPMLVEIPPDDAWKESVALVEFTIKDVTGRSIDSSEFNVFKDQSDIPLEMPVTVGKPMRLPFGHWTVSTHKQLLRMHYQPASFDVVQDTKSVEIKLDIELVPVRFVARGYRGEHLKGLFVQFTQGKLNDQQSTPDLDNFKLWMRPGDTDWTFGATGYKHCERSEPVHATPNGEPQTIEVDMQLGNSH